MEAHHLQPTDSAALTMHSLPQGETSQVQSIDSVVVVSLCDNKMYSREGRTAVFCKGFVAWGGSPRERQTSTVGARAVNEELEEVGRGTKAFIVVAEVESQMWWWFSSTLGRTLCSRLSRQI